MDVLYTTLESIGINSFYNFWVPVLAWSIFVGVFFVLNKLVSLHSTIQYYVRLGLLVSLPLALIVQFIIPTNIISYSVVSEFSNYLLADIIVESTETIASSGAIWSVWHTISVLSILVFVAALLGIVRYFLSLNHLRSIISINHVSASEHIQEIAKSTAADLGIKSSVNVFISVDDMVPYTFGWRRPIIVIPSGLVDEAQLKSVLIHEMVHIYRRDFLFRNFEEILRSVFIFHPLVHLLAAQIQKYREITCDTEVITSSEVNLRSYATLLLNFSNSYKTPGLTTLIPMATSPSIIKERIITMQKMDRSPVYNKRVKKISLLSTFILTMSFVGFVACTDLTQPSMIVEVEELQSVETDVSKTDPTDIFIVVEQMPEPIGGMQAIYAGLVYPESARQAGIEGRTVAQFVVDENGDVTQLGIIRSIGEATDRATMDAISSVKFKPGMQNGKPVKVQFQLPIVFRLSE